MANALTWGWDSGLYDLLNVEYIVVPSDVPPGRPDLLHLSQVNPTVFVDPDHRILRNRDALPRGWIVHRVDEVAESRILPLLDLAREDPRTVAYVPNGAFVPELESDTDATGESVTFTRHDADEIVIDVVANGSGVLVLSEMWAPGWNATVDGNAAPVLQVDRLLRGIPIGPGVHEVTLSYRPPGLRLGLAITSATLIAILTLFVVLTWHERRVHAFATRDDPS
jgi:hypothetical protein